MLLILKDSPGEQLINYQKHVRVLLEVDDVEAIKLIRLIETVSVWNDDEAVRQKTDLFSSQQCEHHDCVHLCLNIFAWEVLTK